MKKSALYETVAAITAMLGAILLVFTFYPIINPIQYSIDNDRGSASPSRYIFGIPASILILSGAWFFNRKAQRLKRNEKDSGHKQKPSA